MNIAVLLSGGVDSAVALHEAKKTGYTNITAYYLKVWLEDDASFLGACPWEEDLIAVKAVCKQAKVPLKVVSMQLEYYETVVKYVLDELRRGHTPSPDIFCNQQIKFKAFIQAVHEDVDLIVTGHYAQVIPGVNGGYRLFQAPDKIKDQSYFLCFLNQQQLSRIWFPLGVFNKFQVRNIARSLKLPNKDRPDSQGICFLGNIKYSDFLYHYLGSRPGDIIQKQTGRVLGSHNGFWFYTIGQRTGLGLGDGPWYVVEKNCNENIVYVSHKFDITTAFHHSFSCINPSWISGNAPQRLCKDGEIFLKIKLRHGPKMINCTATHSYNEELDNSLAEESEDREGYDLNRIIVTMEESDKGIAPGQFVVFYVDNECIGGAMIEGTI